jgi:SAM-dependent MidA family methyltransferase
VSAPSFIAEVIEAEGGRVTFARFMELALTHPTLGYYSRADRFLRHGGDFSTAPAISPFFNRTLARLLTELVDASLAVAEAGGAGDARPVSAVQSAGAARAAEAAGAGRNAEAGAPPPVGAAQAASRMSVVELGGGDGHSADAILRFWQEERPDLRDKIAYRIVEVGVRLRERQVAMTAGFAAQGWDVGWGTGLAEAAVGTHPVVIVGNEFLDTVPVHLIRVEGESPHEAYVDVTGASLRQTWGRLSAAAAVEVELLFGTVDPRRLRSLTDDGILEVFPGLSGLLDDVGRAMPAGSFVNLDYGEWYQGVPAAGQRWGLEGRVRRRRTVRGYFKHQLVLDPLARAGKQDLTADVDFAALDLHGRRAGFETVLFTTLARFLEAGGAEPELRTLRDSGPGQGGEGRAARPRPGPPAPPARQMLQPDALEADRQATVLENLLDEADLGGAFKLMVQVRE